MKEKIHYIDDNLNETDEDSYDPVLAEMFALQVETDSEEEAELVDHQELFKKVDFDRTSKIFEEAEKKAKSLPQYSTTSKKGGLINEDYLQNLIRAQVETALEPFAEDIIQRITYQFQKIITSALQAVISPETTKTSETE